jgi:hypothetical protein
MGKGEMKTSYETTYEAITRGRREKMVAKAGSYPCRYKDVSTS